MNNLVMYERIFDICLEAYGAVKFNKLFNTGQVNIEMHNQEIEYRTNNEKNLLLKKGAIN